MNAALNIDPEFEAKCPPLTEEEFNQLEENILSEGVVLMPLIVWDGTIIDGHNRYKIAQEHPEIEFRTHEKQFANRYEAVSWICKNQLGRRNLTPQQKKYLIGLRYDAEKNANGASDGFRGNQYTDLVDDQFGQVPKSTRKKIADETHTSEGYVQRADLYAKGVDAAEEALPGIKDELLLGTIKPKESDVAAIARASPEERREKAELLRVTPDKRTKPRDSPENQPSSAKRARQEYQEIGSIYTGINDGASAGEDSALDTMRGAVGSMIRVCDTLFKDFPHLLKNKAYRQKVIAIMQEPKQYILQIEGDAK